MLAYGIDESCRGAYNSMYMANRVFMNEDEIVEIIVDGDQTVESVEAMGRQAERLITERRSLGKRCLVLDNLLQIGTVGPDARKAVVRLSEQIDYDRLALLGKGGIMRFGTSLMLRASGRSYHMRYFDDRQQATEWLMAYARPE